jgi:lysozyme family protein
MADFNELMKDILANEGGYVWNKKDPGGETNYGITKRTYPNVDIKNLTPAKAIAIYERDFWPKLYSELSTGLAYQLFDFGINAGKARAGKVIQALCVAGGKDITVDGAYGPNTHKAVLGLNEAVLEEQFKFCRVAYYLNRTDANKNFTDFIRSWIRRCHGYGLMDEQTRMKYNTALASDKEASAYKLK